MCSNLLVVDEAVRIFCKIFGWDDCWICVTPIETTRTLEAPLIIWRICTTAEIFSTCSSTRDFMRFYT